MYSSGSITGSKDKPIKINKIRDGSSHGSWEAAQPIDRLLTFGYRWLRHILNPRDTWERIRRGPVFGRPLDS